MTRYIRTKNFVVELETWMKIDNDILIISGVKHKIVKQADTIEELCDEIVGNKNGISEFPVVMPNNRVAIDYLIKNFQEVYGAIWTNKGLIYVAKMNEKGELELL